MSVLLGTAYPAFVQQFKVKPNEQQLELPYIDDNITATSNAFGLSQIEQQVRDTPALPLSAGQLKDNRTTVSNIRLWRPSTLEKNFAVVPEGARVLRLPRRRRRPVPARPGRDAARDHGVGA